MGLARFSPAALAAPPCAMGHPFPITTRPTQPLPYAAPALSSCPSHPLQQWVELLYRRLQLLYPALPVTFGG